MMKNRIELNPQGELSDEIKSELDKRYQDYIDNPDSVIPLEDVKNELMKKYGIPLYMIQKHQEKTSC